MSTPIVGTPTTPTISPSFAAQLTPDSAIPKLRPRLSVSIEGLDKTGKTYWALMTAPDPIALVTNDPGTQRIVELARAKGRVIHQLVLNWEAPAKLSKSASEINKEEWSRWIDTWNRYNKFAQSVLTELSIRSWVTDTETDTWHLGELAYFGKGAGNSNQDARTKLNFVYQDLYWDLYKRRPDINLILIHRLKKKYIKTNTRNPDAPADWNGEYETDDFNRVAFLVDLTLRMEWDKDRKDFVSYLDPNKAFRYYSSDNAHILSKRWYGQQPADPSAFWNLGMEVFPETVDTPEIWGVD